MWWDLDDERVLVLVRAHATERHTAGVPRGKKNRARLEKKSFSSPDEVRPMSGKGQVEVVNVGDGVIGKATFEPGWRWSEHVKPMAAHLDSVVTLSIFA